MFLFISSSGAYDGLAATVKAQLYSASAQTVSWMPVRSPELLLLDRACSEKPPPSVRGYACCVSYVIANRQQFLSEFKTMRASAKNGNNLVFQISAEPRPIAEKTAEPSTWIQMPMLDAL